jgi:hypothetical protein
VRPLYSCQTLAETVVARGTAEELGGVLDRLLRPERDRPTCDDDPLAWRAQGLYSAPIARPLRRLRYQRTSVPDGKSSTQPTSS